MGRYLLAFLFFAFSANAKCPDWAYDKNKVPVCPEQQMLGTEYPAIAHVIAEQEHSAGEKKEPERDRVIQLAWKLLVYSKDKPPLIYLSASKDTVNALLQFIDKQDIPAGIKKQYKEHIRPVEDKKYWMQDRFQSFINPETGKVQLREILKHEAGSIRSVLESIHKDCPLIEIGEPLRPFYSLSKDGRQESEYGGNIEPVCRSGFCIHGDNQQTGYARQYCSASEEFKAPAGWLDVGHVDEYVSTYPIPNKKCDVAIAIADYDLAIETLKSDPTARLVKKVTDEAAFKKVFYPFCDAFEEKQVSGADPENDKSSHGAETSSKRPRKEPKIRKCHEARVSDFLAFIKGDLDQLNQKIQRDVYAKVASNLKERTEKDLKARYPNETCSVKVVKVPQIVYERKRGASSFFPNPTNGVHVQDHLLLPDPLNGSLREVIKKNFQEVGLGVSLLDSLSLHGNEGNLHCATNSLPYCRGNGIKFTKPAYPTNDPGRVPAELSIDDPLTTRLLDEGTPEVKAKTVSALVRGEALSYIDLPPNSAKKWIERLLGVAKSTPNASGEVGKLLLDLQTAGFASWKKLYENAKPENQARMLERVEATHFIDREMKTNKAVFIELAQQAVLSSDPQLAEAALRLLSDDFPSSLKPLTETLRKLASSKQMGIQEAAVIGLYKIGKLTGEALKHAVYSPSEEARLRAAYSLDAIEDSNTKEEYFGALLGDKSKEVRHSTIKSAASSPKAYVHFSNVLKNFPDDTKETVEQFLLWTKPLTAIRFVQSLLNNRKLDQKTLIAAVQKGLRAEAAEILFNENPRVIPIEFQKELLDIGDSIWSLQLLYAALKSRHSNVQKTALAELLKGDRLLYMRRSQIPALERAIKEQNITGTDLQRFNKAIEENR